MKVAILIKRPIDGRYIAIPMKEYPRVGLLPAEAWVNAVIVSEYDLPREIRWMFSGEKEDGNVDG